MNTQLLKIFVQVARQLSFVAVAEDLELNASSISRSIAQLEEQLGVRLFHRTTRSMTLTEAGEHFLARVPGILEELDVATNEVRSLTVNPGGELRLTSSVAFGEEKIMPLIPSFQQQFPDIRLHLLFTDENIDLIDERVDLAVRLGQQEISGMIATKLMDTSYGIYAVQQYLEDKASITDPDDLEQHRIIHHGLQSFRASFRFRSKRDGSFREYSFENHHKAMVISSPISLRTAIGQGLGLGLLADWMNDTRQGEENLIDVFPDYEVTATDFDTAVWAIYPSRNFLPQKTRVMIDFLKKYL